MAKPNRVQAFEAGLENLLADAFRRPGWRVRRSPSKGDVRPDLIVEGGGHKYLVEFKRCSEGRSDRLIPLLSQAILQAQAHARLFPDVTVPVAVVGAARIPRSVAENLKQFASQVAPDMAIGVIDSEGLRAFAGHGLEMLNASPSRSARIQARGHQRLPHLFSDLNQWMLKILLARRISCPRLASVSGMHRSSLRLQTCQS